MRPPAGDGNGADHAPGGFEGGTSPTKNPAPGTLGRRLAAPARSARRIGMGADGRQGQGDVTRCSVPQHALAEAAHVARARACASRALAILSDPASGPSGRGGGRGWLRVGLDAAGGRAGRACDGNSGTKQHLRPHEPRAGQARGRGLHRLRGRGPVSQTGSPTAMPPSMLMPPDPLQVVAPGLQARGDAHSASVVQGLGVGRGGLGANHERDGCEPRRS
jgi:hypothetical protein